MTHPETHTEKSRSVNSDSQRTPIKGSLITVTEFVNQSKPLVILYRSGKFLLIAWGIIGWLAIMYYLGILGMNTGFHS